MESFDEGYDKAIACPFPQKGRVGFRSHELPELAIWIFSDWGSVFYTGS